MKTIKKVLFCKEYESPIAYGYKKEHRVKTYIKVILCFDFREGLRFTVSVANMSFCHRNPFKAFIRVLEHESIGMAKYQQMKEDTRKCGLYKKLDVGFLNHTVNN
ncbi:hypothetical protein [Clostridium guangxiense]|uniref:hypothetical protein n=1 Tax=Clostridium guangxiense TaxID=1662055 RepID=UPI001E5B72AA|nr:hypothetical protein [Clostridium guangxiense]MCD2345792.1 hypothetical protein [Clostridium guangxiense]